MSKNLVLCADGTGNQGGHTPDSNVYRLYRDIIKDDRQLVFYDNGVGTSQNKFWRGLTGAFGIGFSRNIRDLYFFLALNFCPGDRVYLLGFSRGAATVRALNAFIDTCGLIDSREIETEELRRDVGRLYHAYRWSRGSKPDMAKLFGANGLTFHQLSSPIVHFLGVWDTVAALGLSAMKVGGLLPHLAQRIFEAVDWLIDRAFPHRFHTYGVANVTHAVQALSIDDERTSFWPLVWPDQPSRPGRTSIQVWFPGVHSDVGGSYPRAGLAYVAYEWMLTHAQSQGLLLPPEALSDAARRKHQQGKKHDSRDGAAVFFRYHPRHIDELTGKTARIHESALARMERKTGNYAPLFLPTNFVVDHGTTTGPPLSWQPKNRSKLEGTVRARKELYFLFIAYVLGMAGWAIRLWWSGYPGTRAAMNGLQSFGLGVLDYVLPRILEPWAYWMVVDQPWWLLATVVVLLLCWGIRKLLRERIRKFARADREEFLRAAAAPPPAIARGSSAGGP